MFIRLECAFNKAALFSASGERTVRGAADSLVGSRLLFSCHWPTQNPSLICCVSKPPHSGKCKSGLSAVKWNFLLLLFLCGVNRCCKKSSLAICLQALSSIIHVFIILAHLWIHWSYKWCIIFFLFLFHLSLFTKANLLGPVGEQISFSTFQTRPRTCVGWQMHGSPSIDVFWNICVNVFKSEGNDFSWQ